MLSKVSCPQIWYIDREKEQVGGRPAKLNEEKDDRDLEPEIKKKETKKKQRRHFFVGKTT